MGILMRLFIRAVPFKNRKTAFQAAKIIKTIDYSSIGLVFRRLPIGRPAKCLWSLEVCIQYSRAATNVKPHVARLASSAKVSPKYTAGSCPATRPASSLET